MTQWTWQYRVTSNGADDHSNHYTHWRTSARPYEKAEDAAAAVAHCQAVLAVNGVILECRLVPHQPKHLDGDAAAEKLIEAVTPEVTHPIGFTAAKS